MNNPSKHIAIIGNGIAGITCARHIRKRDADCTITVISAETEYFFSRTALMYVYMGHMKFEHTQPYENGFWAKNRIDLVFKFVESVQTDSSELHLSDGKKLKYDELVLATGAKPNMFGWKGQDLKGVGGLFSYQDLQNMETYTKEIKRGVVVGGGLIGVEMAEMLHSRGIEVTFLVREHCFWEHILPDGESSLIMRHMKEHHVDLRLKTELDEIIGDENGRVKAVRTKSGEIIECGWVGLTAGVSPNVAFLTDSNIELGRGVLVDAGFKTNIDNVHAIGDCAEFKIAPNGRPNIEQVWYTGKLMGETLAKTLTGSPSLYNPGHWFNSAKFFDIEYQTYGAVYPKLRENEADFYWEHSKGKICVHLVYNKNTREFIGINTFGIRMRHDAFNHWLNEKASIEHIMAHLKDANFDPELYKQYEEEIIEKFNKENGTNIQLKQKSWKRLLNYISR
ncbi:MAG: NADPH-dependent 2,4-dienoyl-CoA reductase/sulfur reductase-like enzyme [Saprospiraceae bacterium]|jgi:NADPH-dependent 2,4-dienoyl-CoA reductase/sulfur reductase-like enzyme